MKFLRLTLLALFLCSGVTASYANEQLIVIEDKTPYTPSEADRALNQKIIDELSADPKLEGAIAVSSHQGNVHLSGQVEGVAMIYHCVDVLKNMDGVKNVNIDKLDR